MVCDWGATRAIVSRKTSTDVLYGRHVLLTPSTNTSSRPHHGRVAVDVVISTSTHPSMRTPASLVGGARHECPQTHTHSLSLSTATVNTSSSFNRPLLSLSSSPHNRAAVGWCAFLHGRRSSRGRRAQKSARLVLPMSTGTVTMTACSIAQSGRLLSAATTAAAAMYTIRCTTAHRARDVISHCNGIVVCVLCCRGNAWCEIKRRGIGKLLRFGTTRSPAYANPQPQGAASS